MQPCIHIEGGGRGANTCFNNNYEEYFPVLARMRIQALHLCAQTSIPHDLFLAYACFVPGGKMFLSFRGHLFHLNVGVHTGGVN